MLAKLSAKICYGGNSKHKQYPHLFALPPFEGERGDATLCDQHAGFGPDDMTSVPRLLKRGVLAGLVGTGRIVWVIGNNGWIYECRLTNAGRCEYHGYPVRASEPICHPVYKRFSAWANDHGSLEDKQAAAQCKALYGFKT